MEIVYKLEKVELISSRLKLPKNLVSSIIDLYVAYLQNKIAMGETVKFLNICYLRVNSKKENNFETLAYVSNEISMVLSVGEGIVYRVLLELQESIINDLKKDKGCSIRGLVRIRLEKNSKGEYKVRTKKSTIYNGKDVYITTLGSFKRKVEMVS